MRNSEDILKTIGEYETQIKTLTVRIASLEKECDTTQHPDVRQAIETMCEREKRQRKEWAEKLVKAQRKYDEAVDDEKRQDELREERYRFAKPVLERVVAIATKYTDVVVSLCAPLNVSILLGKNLRVSVSVGWHQPDSYSESLVQPTLLIEPPYKWNDTYRKRRYAIKSNKSFNEKAVDKFFSNMVGLRDSRRQAAATKQERNSSLLEIVKTMVPKGYYAELKSSWRSTSYGRGRPSGYERPYVGVTKVGVSSEVLRIYSDRSDHKSFSIEVVGTLNKEVVGTLMAALCR
jgi:hypothetical protein